MDGLFFIKRVYVRLGAVCQEQMAEARRKGNINKSGVLFN